MIDRDVLQRAADLGLTMKETAAAIGDSYMAVYRASNALGVVFKAGRRGRRQTPHLPEIRRLAALGYSKATIADHVGLTLEGVRQLCNTHGIETLRGNINHDVQDRIAALYRQDMTVGDVARAAGCSEAVARGSLNRLGLTPVPTKFAWHAVAECAAAGMTKSEAARHLGRGVPAIFYDARVHNITFAAKGKPGKKKQ